MRHEIKIEDIDALRDQLLDAIDAVANVRRPARFDAHVDKEAEALALMADPNLSAAETPNLSREAARKGADRFDIAVVVLTNAHRDRMVAAEIEDVRLAAKASIRAATTVRELRAAFKSACDSLAAFG